MVGEATVAQWPLAIPFLPQLHHSETNLLVPFFGLGMKGFWKRRGNISDISTFRLGVSTIVTHVAGMRRKFSLILPATREVDKRGKWGTIASSTGHGGFRFNGSREFRCYLSMTSVGNDVWL